MFTPGDKKGHAKRCLTFGQEGENPGGWYPPLGRPKVDFYLGHPRVKIVKHVCLLLYSAPVGSPQGVGWLVGPAPTHFFKFLICANMLTCFLAVMGYHYDCLCLVAFGFADICKLCFSYISGCFNSEL